MLCDFLPRFLYKTGDKTLLIGGRYAMNGQTVRLGLIGKDVSKSLSESMHTFILKEWGYACEYERFSVGKEDFDCAMRRLLGDFDGFNVTIPYKRDVMAYLDDVTGDALDYGAVNTVVPRLGKGFNTDGAGFMLMLRVVGIEVKGKRILVLGGGGSGRSTAAALKLAGARVSVYQRTKEKLLELCQELGVEAESNPYAGGYDILVNCTGVGMHDTEGRSPVGSVAFDGASAAIDLIYTPKESEFLRLAREAGLQTLNGESMLFYQAYFADCIYLGKEPCDEEAKALYEKYIK